VPKDTFTSNHQETENQNCSSDTELIPQSTSIEFSTEQELEVYILNSLEDEVIQDRIRGFLQDIMREELSKLSMVLRESIRNWVFKEKQKYHLAPGIQSQEVTDKLEQVKADKRKVEEENQKLKREIELKEHENKIILSALKTLTPKPN